MSEYNFTKDPCNVGRLKQEIEASEITIALDYISLFGTALSVFFKAVLSGPEETILNGLVAAHTGEPLPDDYVQNVAVTQIDSDTSALVITPKMAPTGWHQVYHEVEFKTSQLDSIHDKDVDNEDCGFSTMKFFDAEDNELTVQGEIDTDCVRTHFDFVPTHAWAIKSGKVAQIVAPESGVYLWCIGAPGILDKPFCNGGINLEFLDGKSLVGLDGKSATVLPANVGLRFVIRHPAGFKHRIQAIFEYFKE